MAHYITQPYTYIMKTKKLTYLAIAILMLGGIAFSTGCEKKSDAEKAADAVEDAANDAADSIKDATN
jgi:hypothetical protein